MRKRKLFNCILASTLVLTLIVTLFAVTPAAIGETTDEIAIWSGNAAETFAGGEGTKANPWLIENADQLYKMVSEFDSYTESKGKYFEIVKDIYINDVTDGKSISKVADRKNWLEAFGDAIATATASKDIAFAGTLDGNGHTIYGLNVTSTTKSTLGLFPAITNGTVIQNLNFENLFIGGGNGYGGTIAGIAFWDGSTSYPALITNCSVSNATIGLYSNLEYAAGFVGDTRNCTIYYTYCSVYDTSITNWDISGIPGGITGGAYSSSGTIKLKNCYSAGYFPTNSKVSKATCSSVYTDVAIPEGNTTTGIEVVEAAQMKGEAAKTAMNSLDWFGAWVTVDDGYPVVRENPNLIWNGGRVYKLTDYKGSGTAADPYLIETPEQLAGVVCVEAIASQFKHFKLVKDMRLNDTHIEDWKNYATNWVWENVRFKGTFMGEAHNIDGLYFSKNQIRLGLFAYVGDATKISNFSMSNAYVYNSISESDNNSGMAIVAGQASAAVDFDRIYVDETCYIEAPNGRGVAGILGRCNGTVNITNSAVLATIKGKSQVGAFIGRHNSGTHVHTINGSFTSANLPLIGNENPTDSENNYAPYADQVGTTQLSADKMIGEAAKTNMPNLDFDWVWKTVENGYPVLREEIVEVWDGESVATTYESGSGTKDDPYIIATAEQLAFVVTKGYTDTPGLYFKLANDIRLNETYKENWKDTAHKWVWENVRFVGDFDGDGHTIDGLFLNGEQGRFGLFSFVGDANIHDLKFTNAYVYNTTDSDKGDTYQGSAFVAGQASAPVSFDKIYIDESCYMEAPNAKGVSALIGRSNQNVTVTNCAVLATISGKTHVGAFFGTHWGGQQTINNSYSTSDLPIMSSRNLVNSKNNYALVGDSYGTTVLSADQMIGENAKENMGALNYNQVWKIVDGSYPVLRDPSYSNKYWNGTAANEFADGTGTDVDPYLISNASELYLLATLDRETTLGQYYKLTNDIEISSVYDNWANDNPYAWAVKKAYLDGFTYTDSFAGTLDGAGHTVSGIYYNDAIEDGGTYAYGLIPFVTADAIIKNITVTDVNATVTGEGAYVGAVAGAAHVMDEDLANPFHMVQFVGVNAENIQIDANSKGDILGGASHGVKFELSNAENIIGNYISHVGIRNCNNGSTYSDDVIIYNTFNIDENTVTNIKNVLLGTSSDYITTINADNKFDIADLVAADEAFSAAAPEEYLVWSQEFNSNQLNTSVWTKSTTAMSKGTTLEYADTATFDGESISLNCLDSKKKDSNGDVIYNISHALTTFDSMSYKYGRLEMRAKIPFGAGAFPSLWLSSRDAMGYEKMCEYSTEIDVFEVFGKTADANRLEACIHKWYNKDGVKTKDECSCGTGYLKGNGYEIDVEKRSQIIEKTAQDEFHTIVFDWTENTMTFSVDGKVYYTATKSAMDNAEQSIFGFGKVTGFDIEGYKTSNDGIFNQYLSVLLTNSMRTKGAGAAYDYEGNASEIVPENLSFEIDYIRLYQKNDGISKINLK